MLNPDLIKDLWKKIDELVDWVKITGKPVLGNIIEMGDNIGGPAALNYLNEKFGDKIPADLVDNVEAAIVAFIDDDYQGVLDELPEGIDDVIDLKQLPDDVEAAWIAANFNAVVSFIKYYAKKKTEE